jgi:hypothetical protein
MFDFNSFATPTPVACDLMMSGMAHAMGCGTAVEENRLEYPVFAPAIPARVQPRPVQAADCAWWAS